MLPAVELRLIVLLAAAGLALYAIARLGQVWHDSARGRLVSVDTGARPTPVMRSDAWGISGRPDELRARRDGVWIPVEWKTQDAPRRGPWPSHRLQLLAYCLLSEERTGRPPPFGILRYGDGTEWRVPWDRDARNELAAVRREMARRYDGRATGSVAKCRACRWRAECDARVGG